eukprot:scaffold317_cov101-Isochrysis_galbana.AAC.7
MHARLYSGSVLSNFLMFAMFVEWRPMTQLFCLASSNLSVLTFGYPCAQPPKYCVFFMLNTNVFLPLLSKPICTFRTAAVSAVRAWRWKFSSGSRWMVRVALFMCEASRPRSLSSCAILSKSALFSVTINESGSSGSRCLSCCKAVLDAVMRRASARPPSPAPLEDPLYLFRRRATGLLDIKDPGTLPDPDESRLAPGMPS